MLLKKSTIGILTLVVLFAGTTLLTAQQKEQVLNTGIVVPESLYTSSINASLDSIGNSLPTFSEFNTSLNFLKFNYIDLDRGLMTVPIQNFRTISKEHFYDTYQEIYQRSYYRSAFERNSGSKLFDIHNYRERFKTKH
jgi:hypothetical protein